MPEQIPLMVDAATQELRQFTSDETIPRGQLLAALQVALTGLVTSNTSGVLASDTILQALGKLQAQASNKVDKVAGKQLSTQDYTTAEKTKLSGIASGATANATDANLRDRSTHSGTQGMETITGLSAALGARVVETAATGAALLPSGTTAQRPDPTLHPGDLLLRGNTDTGKPEWYNRPLLAWKNLVGEDQLGVVDAQVQTLDANIGFTIIYPNGGSAGSPASVARTSTYVENNPFPGHHVICQCQLYAESKWITAPYQPYSGGGSAGASAAHDSNVDKIRVSTGAAFLIVGSNGEMFASPRPTNNYTAPLPCRVLVWKLKGAI